MHELALTCFDSRTLNVLGLAPLSTHIGPFSSLSQLVPHRERRNLGMPECVGGVVRDSDLSRISAVLLALSTVARRGFA